MVVSRPGSGVLRGWAGAAVTVGPAGATLTAVGATVPLAARTRDAAGAAVPNVIRAWTSGNPVFAAVSGSGLER